MGPYLQFLSNLPQAWILGISPGIFLLVVIKWSPTHLKILDSNGMDPTLWVSAAWDHQFPNQVSPLHQRKSIEPRDPANLGLPSCCEKRPSLFFQEKRTDGTDVSIYIYIHLFIYSLFVQHMYIIYTYMCMPISIVKLETRLKLCRPVFTKKQSFKFPVVGNGILNATSGWELHCSSHAKICTYSGPRGSWKSIASLSNGRYHNTLRGFGKSQNMTVDNMQEAKQRSSEVLSKLTGLHDTDSGKFPDIRNQQ